MPPAAPTHRSTGLEMKPFLGSQAVDSCGDSSNVRVSVLLAVALALASCTGRPASAPPPPKVTVVQPVEREITEWDEYTARLEAVDSVEVRPRVSGYLQSIHFQDGAIVKKGDLLFPIDPRPYEAALRRAEADLALAGTRVALARKNNARGANLLTDHAISQEEADIRESDLRQAEAAVQGAEAAVDAARLDVEFTHVTRADRAAASAASWSPRAT